MKKSTITIFIILLFSLISKAQYVEVINSNRPGFSVSPYNVGRGILQVESGIIGSSERLSETLVNRRLGLDVSIRYAYRGDLEFYSDITTQGYWIEDDSQQNSESQKISPIIIGASYKFIEGERFTPTMAVRMGVMYYETFDKRSYGDIDIGLATQHDFAPNWVFISNWRASKVIFNTNLSYVLSITNTIAKNWSWFIENLGEYDFKSNRESKYQNYVSAGMAYLIDNNKQIDIFAGMNTQLETPIYYISIGLSWRLDRRKFNKPTGAESIMDPDFQKVRNPRP